MKRPCTLLLGIILCRALAIGQLHRDSGKLKPLPVHLTHTLADAPLSDSEREQIFRVLDNESVHDSFTNQQRESERETIMRSLVNSVVLARNGSEQILVEGPPSLCGARTQCIRIFIRQGNQLRLVFDSWGTDFSVKTSRHNEFHDIGTETIWSAGETEYRDYRWDGVRYQQVRCYHTIYPQTDGSAGRGSTARSTIIGCR